MKYILKKIVKDSEEVKCCICGRPIKGWGNNPWPVENEEECCDICNQNIVLPARIEMMFNKKNEVKDSAIIDLSKEEINYLIEEEKQAVEDYRQAISMTEDKNALYVLSHILKEEAHHIEMLEQLRDGKVQFADSVDKVVLKLSKKKNDYDEFVIRFYKNNKFDEMRSYYTDDWDDAIGTINDMAKRLGLEVKEIGNIVVAE